LREILKDAYGAPVTRFKSDLFSQNPTFGSEPVSTQTIKPFQIDVSVADLVGRGTRIFPFNLGLSDQNWCIFSEDQFGGNENEALFKLAGRIDARVDSSEFVEKAYELILLRPLDPVGREIYPGLLISQQLSKYDVLKILAAYDEAIGLGNKLIIIPEPSSWLEMAGGLFSGNQPSPSLLVKKDEAII